MSDLKAKFSEMLDSFHARRINGFELMGKDGKALRGMISDLADKAGLDKKPSVWLSHNNKPNAAAGPGSRMMVTTGLLRGFGTHAGGEMPDEMAAVIGHELGHLKHQKLEAGGLTALQLGMPVAAALAYHMIRKARKHGKDDGEALQTINEAMDESIAKGEAALQEAPESEREALSASHRARSALATGAKYCAAAAVGVVASQFAVRSFRHSREFAADQHGAEMASPELMISALEKLKSISEEVMKKESAKHSTADQTMAQKITKAVAGFVSAVHLTHPSVEARIDRLRGL